MKIRFNIFNIIIFLVVKSFIFIGIYKQFLFEVNSLKLNPSIENSFLNSILSPKITIVFPIKYLSN